MEEPLKQLQSLGMLYRDDADIKEKRDSGLETSLDAAEDVEDVMSDVFEDTDFEIGEDNKDESSGSDFRIN